MTFGAFLLAMQRADQDGATLAERLKRREPQAMAELYDRYGTLIYSLILRIVHDTAVAEDLLQETFLRIWNRSQAFDQEKGALGPWILAVARNRAIDYVRSAANRMARNVFEMDETEHPAVFVDLDKGILNSNRIRQVRNALEKLSPDQRSVIELAYFEGLSQSEMAARLGEPLGTVKTWIRTALKHLRAELGVGASA